jgi:hypothetical protein
MLRFKSLEELSTGRRAEMGKGKLKINLVKGYTVNYFRNLT